MMLPGSGGIMMTWKIIYQPVGLHPLTRSETAFVKTLPSKTVLISVCTVKLIISRLDMLIVIIIRRLFTIFTIFP